MCHKSGNMTSTEAITEAKRDTREVAMISKEASSEEEEESRREGEEEVRRVAL